MITLRLTESATKILPILKSEFSSRLCGCCARPHYCLVAGGWSDDDGVDEDN